MKRSLVVLLVCFASLSFAVAQTKLIAHRSHSGEGASKLNTEDNFGLGSPKDIFVIDTITSEKFWVRIDDNDHDSITAARAGYRLLSDSGVHRPPFDSIHWMEPPEQRQARRLKESLTR
jgi:hypothetical protein